MKYPFKSSLSKEKDPYLEKSKVYIIDHVNDKDKEEFKNQVVQKILDDKTGNKFVFIEEPYIFKLETGEFRCFSQGYWTA